jgi:hypothetical protein
MGWVKRSRLLWMVLCGCSWLLGCAGVHGNIDVGFKHSLTDFPYIINHSLRWDGQLVIFVFPARLQQLLFPEYGKSSSRLTLSPLALVLLPLATWARKNLLLASSWFWISESDCLFLFRSALSCANCGYQFKKYAWTSSETIKQLIYGSPIA